jgi:hypothetical protein
MAEKAARKHGLIMRHDSDRDIGWLERALWQLEADWGPLTGVGGPLCFVVDACSDVAANFSADPHLAELATQ